MNRRPRICYSETQKTLMWERWKKGESLQQIAQLFDRNHSSVQRILAESGGIRPVQRHRSGRALRLAEREEISRSLAAGHSIRTIATLLRRAPSTISREISRNGGQGDYRASCADEAAWARAERPKTCKLVGKYQRRMPGFDDQVISMYARGMSVREIQGHLLELYGTQVSPDLISTITDEVLDEVTQWQQRALEAMYPIVYFDALRLKIRDEGTVKNKAVYLALGVRADGRKEVLGLWIEQTEGAKFWLKVFNDLRNRGLHDVLIAVVDGLRGFPEAIEAVYPQAQIQTCIVHLIRNSTTLASWKDRKELAAALKPVYQATNAELAALALEDFADGPWGVKFPTVAAMWRRQWPQVIPFFAYPPEVRTIIYTTNAIESLHMRLRKIVKNRGHFPSDDAATKLLFLALRNIEKDWKMPQRTWKQAANQFAIMFGERFTNAIN